MSTSGRRLTQPPPCHHRPPGRDQLCSRQKRRALPATAPAGREPRGTEAYPHPHAGSVWVTTEAAPRHMGVRARPGAPALSGNRVLGAAWRAPGKKCVVKSWWGCDGKGLVRGGTPAHTEECLPELASALRVSDPSHGLPVNPGWGRAKDTPRSQVMWAQLPPQEVLGLWNLHPFLHHKLTVT